MVCVQFLHEAPCLFLATAELKPPAGLLLLYMYATVVDFLKLYIKKKDFGHLEICGIRDVWYFLS